ncbi:MAG: zinc finger domain-containing protein [Candidatus Odinarchaeia archaeon]
MAELEPPVCSSCGRLIAPDDKAVHFSCPKCGEITIWRCEKCRLFANTYKCIKCNFEGP